VRPCCISTLSGVEGSRIYTLKKCRKPRKEIEFIYQRKKKINKRRHIYHASIKNIFEIGYKE
jgi:hypothetical protein